MDSGLLSRIAKKMEKGEKPEFPPKTKDEADCHTYSFWNRQIISKKGMCKQGPIIDNLKLYVKDMILPSKFEYVEINLQDPNEIKKLIKFINTHYDNKLLKNYSVQYSEDELQNIQYCLSIQHESDEKKRIVGIICCTIENLQINKNKIVGVIPDFLCVHTKLRGSRMTDVLINEFENRMICKGMTMGMFKIKDMYIKDPIIETKLYHRPLNYMKLFDYGLYEIEKETSTKSIVSYYETFSEKDPSFVPLTKEYIYEAYELMSEYMSETYCLSPIYTKDEFEKTFLNSMTNSYVFIQNKHVTDFASYKNVKLVDNDKIINAGIITYFSHQKQTPLCILNNLMNMAKSNGCDLIFMYDLMSNGELQDILKFVEDKKSHFYYYLFNYSAILTTSQVCKIL